MVAKRILTAGAYVIVAAIAGCSTYEVIPDHLDGQVRRDIGLEQVEKTPESYRGETVVWGGEILSTSLERDTITVEIFQLPLDRTLRPLDSKAASKGRFLAIDAKQDMKEAGALKKGTLVTVIGEVRGVVPSRLDQDQYDAPALLIRDMTVWERRIGRTQYPLSSPFVGYRPFIFWDSRRVSGE